MTTFRNNIAPGLAAAALAACLLSLSPREAPARSPQSRSNVLAKGNLYYSSDDVTDRAAAEYRKVRMSHAGKKEAEAAQYLLASYYHRKFYIVLVKRQQTDADALREAEAEYKNYIKQYARARAPEWVAESHFYLSLVLLQNGRRAEALQQLNELRGVAAKDSKVYIYDVIWSPYAVDRVEGQYDARQLADEATRLINRNLDLYQVVRELRRWCRVVGRG